MGASGAQKRMSRPHFSKQDRVLRKKYQRKPLHPTLMIFANQFIVVVIGGIILWLSYYNLPLGKLKKFSYFVHFASVGILLGTVFWVTFFSGMILFKHIPSKVQYSELQSHIFPVYFSLSFILVTMAIGSWMHIDSPNLESPEMALWVIAMAVLVVQVVLFGPLVTWAMRILHRHMKTDTSFSPGTKKAKRNFQILHGLSTCANLFVVLVTVYQMYVLSERMQLVK